MSVTTAPAVCAECRQPMRIPAGQRTERISHTRGCSRARMFPHDAVRDLTRLECPSNDCPDIDCAPDLTMRRHWQAAGHYREDGSYVIVAWGYCPACGTEGEDA